MNNQLPYCKISSIIIFLVILSACGTQMIAPPTETPTVIALSELIPITSSPLSTQPILVLAETSTPTSTPFFNSSSQNGILSSEQQDEIIAIINSYFEMRYQALSFPQPEGFQLNQIGRLVSSESDAKVFLDNELAKLMLDMKYRELNGSRYVTYEYFLDFREFSFDVATELVSVLVIEDSETTSENSSRPAHMSGLQHVIDLRNEHDEWKIVSDYYNDFLWRTIRRDGETKDDMLIMISTIEALITPSSSP